MRSGMLKTVAFIVPLAGLSLLMARGERFDDAACPGNLAYLKSQQIIEERPGVVDVAREDFRWVGDCRFAMTGYADITRGSDVDRAAFQVVVAHDPQTGIWREISLSIQP